MNKEFKKTHDEITFYQKIETLTDREIQELQAFYHSQNKKKIESIKNNLQFFFYFTICIVLISIFILINKR